MTPRPQLDLFPYDGVPHQVTSETSRRAAVKARPKRPNQKAQILAAMEQAGAQGHTAPELVAKLNMPLQSVHPRLVELCNEAKVERVMGEFRTNRFGRDCQVWRVTG